MNNGRKSLCRSNAVDTIVASSLTTFSLRREELYKTLGELRELGVTVQLEEEGINTAGESGDILLSTLAGFLKPPKPPKPVTVPYGIGDEEEGKVVKHVFSLFLSGMGRVPIARMLNAENVPLPHKDNPTWTYCDVRRILSEEKYKDEGVIDEETWERAVKVAASRNAAYGRRPPSNSPLVGLITCGVCGNHFTRRERGKSSLWLCKNYLKNGRKACPSRCVRESVLYTILDGVNEIDNITVWPDGNIVINTPTDEIRTNWR